MKIRSFIYKLLLFSLPFVAFILLYFYLDPFKVVRHYSCYYQSGKPNYITLNKDYVSTENWVNRQSQYHFDSYIFGNSRSMFYEVGTWKNYIKADSEQCYHFDASGESIYGIAKKFSFLSEQKATIRNALIVIDAGALNKADNSAGHIFVKDPRLSGESQIGFQVDCLKDFFDFDFVHALLDFKLSGKVKDYMKKDFLLDDRPFFYDSVTNEIRMDAFEEMIKRDTAAYYAPRQSIFYTRDMTIQRVSDPVIKKQQLALLQTIKKVLDNNQTNYKIVISPLYDQLKLNPTDLRVLEGLFGADHVYDFSGINDFTRSKYNYYEISHYRPHIADAIMKIVYSEDPRAMAQR
jgi:hypothetical protein